PVLGEFVMNGAESLVRTLVGGGVNVCFANPGTSEMHFVAALDRVDGMRCVLGLFEGVVTGAADGYARMTGNPAATLLHLGPGMAKWPRKYQHRKQRRAPEGQHGRRPRDLPPALRRATDPRYRARCQAVLALGQTLAGCKIGCRRRCRGDRRRAHPAGA